MIDDAQLAKHLLDHGIATPEQLQRGLQLRKINPRSLYTLLIEHQICREEDIVGAAAQLLSQPCAHLGRFRFDVETLSLMSPAMAERNGVLPLAIHEELGQRKLILAMLDPLDIMTMDEISTHTGLDIHPVLVGPLDLRDAQRRAWSASPAAQAALDDDPFAALSPLPELLPEEAPEDSWADFFEADEPGLRASSSDLSREMRARPSSGPFDAVPSPGPALPAQEDSEPILDLGDWELSQAPADHPPVQTGLAAFDQAARKPAASSPPAPPVSDPFAGFIIEDDDDEDAARVSGTFIASPTRSFGGISEASQSLSGPDAAQTSQAHTVQVDDADIDAILAADPEDDSPPRSAAKPSTPRQAPQAPEALDDLFALDDDLLTSAPSPSPPAAARRQALLGMFDEGSLADLPARRGESLSSAPRPAPPAPSQGQGDAWDEALSQELAQEASPASAAASSDLASLSPAEPPSRSPLKGLPLPSPKAAASSVAGLPKPSTLLQPPAVASTPPDPGAAQRRLKLSSLRERLQQSQADPPPADEADAQASRSSSASLRAPSAPEASSSQHTLSLSDPDPRDPGQEPSQTSRPAPAATPHRAHLPTPANALAKLQVKKVPASPGPSTLAPPIIERHSHQRPSLASAEDPEVTSLGMPVLIEGDPTYQTSEYDLIAAQPEDDSPLEQDILAAFLGPSEPDEALSASAVITAEGDQARLDALAEMLRDASSMGRPHLDEVSSVRAESPAAPALRHEQPTQANPALTIEHLQRMGAPTPGVTTSLSAQATRHVASAALQPMPAHLTDHQLLHGLIALLMGQGIISREELIAASELAPDEPAVSMEKLLELSARFPK